jgi:hypothetical protein
MSDQTGPEADQFSADFRDGAAMAGEWIEGKGDLPDDLVAIVRDMPSELSGLEAGFLAYVGATVRGARQGVAVTPDPAKAKLLLEATPSAQALPAPLVVDIGERERAARFKELARRNAELWRGGATSL